MPLTTGITLLDEASVSFEGTIDDWPTVYSWEEGFDFIAVESGTKLIFMSLNDQRIMIKPWNTWQDVERQIGLKPTIHKGQRALSLLYAHYLGITELRPTHAPE